MVNVIQKQDELIRNLRIDTILSITEKRNELLNKLELLEQIEIDFKYKQELTLSDCFDCVQKVKSL